MANTHVKEYAVLSSCTELDILSVWVIVSEIIAPFTKNDVIIAVPVVPYTDGNR